nr:hypothetical protein [Helicobacter pylori]
MHEIIQKGMDGLIQRLDNDLKDGNSRILVPIECIQGLCLIGNLKPDELCVLFIKIFELIRSSFKIHLSRDSLSFMGGAISGLNRQIYICIKNWSKKRGKYDKFFLLWL